jgi:hypothetical protein
MADKKASEASKVMRDPKMSHEEKSNAASELGKSKGKTGGKKK